MKRLLAERQGSGIANDLAADEAAEEGASQEAFQEGRVDFRDGVLAL